MGIRCKRSLTTGLIRSLRIRLFLHCCIDHWKKLSQSIQETWQRWSHRISSSFASKRYWSNKRCVREIPSSNNHNHNDNHKTSNSSSSSSSESKRIFFKLSRGFNRKGRNNMSKIRHHFQARGDEYHIPYMCMVYVVKKYRFGHCLPEDSVTHVSLSSWHDCLACGSRKILTVNENLEK